MTNILEIKSKNIPTITLDSVGAVYIRFSDNEVAKTIDDSSENYVCTIDIDANDDVVGVELFGMESFSIEGTVKLLQKKFRRLPNLSKAVIACA